MLKFDKMWESYPTIQGEKTPCKTNGNINFDDQCAIRLGSCLATCGVDTSKLVPKSRHCWQHNTKLGHILAAEELANGLAKYKIEGIATFKKIDPSTFQAVLAGKTGIIFSKIFGLGLVKILHKDREIILIYGKATVLLSGAHGLLFHAL